MNITIEELYNKLINNKDLCGEFELSTDDSIIYNVFEYYEVRIAESLKEFNIDIYKKANAPWHLETYLTHWHPSDDEVYDDICKLGTKGNVTVIHKTPLYEALLYSGAKDGCKYKRTWLFGKYYYLYAE